MIRFICTWAWASLFLNDLSFWSHCICYYIFSNCFMRTIVVRSRSWKFSSLFCYKIFSSTLRLLISGCHWFSQVISCIICSWTWTLLWWSIIIPTLNGKTLSVLSKFISIVISRAWCGFIFLMTWWIFILCTFNYCWSNFWLNQMISWIISSWSWDIFRSIIVFSSLNGNLLGSFSKFFNNIIVAWSNIITWFWMNHWRLIFLLGNFTSSHWTLSEIMIWFIITWSWGIVLNSLLKSLAHLWSSCAFKILDFIGSRTGLLFFFFGYEIISPTISESECRSFISYCMRICIISSGAWFLKFIL